MPYVFYEELPEGAEEAQVVEQSVFDSVQTSYEEACAARDDAIEKLTRTHDELRDYKAKYAKVVLDGVGGSGTMDEEGNGKPTGATITSLFN